MAWHFMSDNTYIQGISDVSDTQNVPLGTIVRAFNTDNDSVGEFIYLSCAVALTPGEWVKILMDSGAAARISANGVDPVGVAVGDFSAAGTEYGWFQISGKAVGACLTQFADNAQVWATATAGSVDDASVAGDLVNLAKGASTTVVDSGVADFEIHRPWMDNNSSAT